MAIEDRFVAFEGKSGAINFIKLSAVTRFSVGSLGKTVSVFFLDGERWVYEEEDAKNVLDLLKETLLEKADFGPIAPRDRCTRCGERTEGRPHDCPVPR